jgi:hypothetical protein
MLKAAFKDSIDGGKVYFGLRLKMQEKNERVCLDKTHTTACGKGNGKENEG